MLNLKQLAKMSAADIIMQKIEETDWSNHRNADGKEMVATWAKNAIEKSQGEGKVPKDFDDQVAALFDEHVVKGWALKAGKATQAHPQHVVAPNAALTARLNDIEAKLDKVLAKLEAPEPEKKSEEANPS